MLGHYLLFDRTCAEALACYAEAFGIAVAEVMRYGDAPPDPSFPVAEEDKNLVMHSRLPIDGVDLMCADSTGRITPGDNQYVSVTTPDEAAIQKAWDVLKQGAEVYMDLQPTFFAPLHGSLRDRFGINWMFSAYSSQQ